MKRTIFVLAIFVVIGIVAVVVINPLSYYKPSSGNTRQQTDKQDDASVQDQAQSEPENDQSEKTPEQSTDDSVSEKTTEKSKPNDQKSQAQDAKAEEPESKDPSNKEEDKPSDDKDESAKEDKSADEKEFTEDGEPLEMVNLNNVEMKQIIRTIAEWTSKPVIPYDDEVMKQKVTIYAIDKLPRSQALSLIYSALRSKGYAPEETQAAIYLKPLAKAKYGVVPTLGLTEPLAKIVDKSQIVEKYFKIDNCPPSKLQEIVTPLTAEYGHVTADDSTGTLSVIDTVENLQRVQQIIDQFDVAEYGQSITEVFRLETGDPTEIVQVIELIMNNKTSRRNNRKKSPSKEDTQATSVLISSSKMPLLLIPENRRKWIIAKGAAEDIKEVAKWIDELDKKDEVTSEQTVVQIKYVDVREVAQAVEKTLKEMPGSQLKANIVVQPLPQARQIVVFGSEENRKIVEALIAEIDLPTSGIFDQKTIGLKFADPDQIKKNIEELYGEQQVRTRYYYSYSRRGNQRSSDTVKVISYPTAGKITVIASPENITKISEQIKEWDVPLDLKRQPYRIIVLQNSDPKQMSDLLSTLFSEQSESSMSFWDYYYGGGSDSKKKIVGSLYGQLSFEPVPDTKKIIVISKIPEAYEVIEKLVYDLDRQETAEVPKVITLKYADSEDLCDQLNAILNEPGTVATIRRASRGLSAYSNNSSSSNSNSSDSKNSSDDNSSGSNSTSEIKPWWNAGVARNRTDETLPTSNLIGKVRFVPVQRSKALLVLAPPEYMDDMVAMIEELDQPGKQVMIKAVILSVDHSKVTSLGLKLSSDASSFGDIGENSLTALAEITRGFEMGAFTVASSSSINAIVDFLEKHTNARILNQPTLWTKDNEEAVFFRGQQVAFVESSNTSSEGTNTRDQVEYRPVGVTLRIRPNITPEKAVDTTINLNISQVQQDTINGNIATSELDTTTHVIVQDGETIMLGGILFQNESDIERKVPFFGDIPIVGEAFKHTETDITNNELLIFITPYVVENTSQRESTELIPVVKDGFKTLDHSKKILDESMAELKVTPNWQEEEEQAIINVE